MSVAKTTSTDFVRCAEQLHPWFYPVFGATPGVGSPHTPEELCARTDYRHKILCTELAKHYSMQGKMVLDIASNCGYWGTIYADGGAVKYLGVEGRETFVKQGELLWSHQKFDHDVDWEFIQGDVLEADIWDDINEKGPFDFALCAGLLYHIVDHEYVLNRILDTVREAAVVDTRVSEEGHKKTEVFREKHNWKFDSLPNRRNARHPTLSGLVDFINNKGFRVIVLPVSPSLPTAMVKNDDYAAGRRVAILARRR